jgi:hypothetical protein
MEPPCVFDSPNLNMGETLALLGEERRLWMMARARGLSYLMPPSQEYRVCVLVAA